MRVHDLKTWPEFWAPLYRGVKSFEVRENDRDYQVGDILRLWEWDPEQKLRSGRSLTYEVTYIADLGKIGHGSLVGMQLKRVNDLWRDTANPPGPNDRLALPWRSL